MSVECSSYVTDEVSSDDIYMCLCCLKEEVPFINLLTCRHSKHFHQVFHQTNFRLKLICRQCHALLIKMEAFKKQVNRSIDWLNKVIYHNIKKHELQPVLTLKHTPIKITFIHENQLITYDIKNEQTNGSSIEIGAPANQHKGNWSEQSLAEQWEGCSPKDVEIPPTDDLDDPMEVKTEAVYCSDQEEGLPLSKIVVIAGCKEVDSRSPRPRAVDKFAGKVAAVCLTKEEFLLEKEQERKKESFLKLPFRCVHCAVGFDHEDTLQEHMLKRHVKKDGSFVCDLCRSVLNTVYSYKEHYRRHLKRYECCECGKRYNTWLAAVEHYKEQHGAIPTAFTCEQCGFTTDSNRRYRYHRDKHKEKPQCSSCGKTFVNRSGLKSHVLTVHRGPKHAHACTHSGCGKSFGSKSGLRAHCASVHRSSGAYCGACRAHFKCGATLRHHLATHSAHLNKDDWKFVCDACGKKFPLKSSLQDHVDWAHLGRKTHQCERCPKVYKTARSLQRHREYVHDKKRPPKNKICDHCGKGFTTLAILRTHIRTHTGERPLTCPRCPATFAHPSALYTHNRLLHNKTAPGLNKTTA